MSYADVVARVSTLQSLISQATPGAAAPTGFADVLATARREERALVTENVRDYRPLEIGLLAEGSHHAGLVYTSNRQFPRGDPATTGRLVRALDALLRDVPNLRDRSIFLERADR